MEPKMEEANRKREQPVRRLEAGARLKKRRPGGCGRASKGMVRGTWGQHFEGSLSQGRTLVQTLSRMRPLQDVELKRMV